MAIAIIRAAGPPGTTLAIREGANITIAADGTIASTGGGGGGGTPGGSSGQLQINNGGAFGGVTLSGDATANSSGVVTVAKVNGSTLGGAALLNVGTTGGTVADGGVVAGHTTSIAANTTAITANTAAIATGGTFVFPAEFTFPFSTWKVNISGHGNRMAGTGPGYVCDFRPELYHQPALLSAQQYWVDISLGNDSHTGLYGGVANPWANAFQSIFKATQAGNAVGVPFCVFVKTGVYPRGNGFSGVLPTQKSAYIPVGGRAVTGSFDNLTWTLTTGTTYQVTKSGAVRCNDLTAAKVSQGGPNSLYTYYEMTLAASLSACEATQGTWYTDGTTVYVNRIDGAAPTNANTRVYLSVGILSFTTAMQDLYFGGQDFLSGWDFEGYGPQMSNTVGSTGSFAAVNCTFRYCYGRGTQSDNTSGLICFINCDASCNGDDAFNIHSSLATTSGPNLQPFVLLYNCTGINNGRSTSLSVNGLTRHENVVVLDINGYYAMNRGGNVANSVTAGIGPTPQIFLIGTLCEYSVADVNFGGGNYPLEMGLAERAWLLDTVCRARPGNTGTPATSSTALQINGNHVSTRNHVNLFAGTVNNGGTLDTF